MEEPHYTTYKYYRNAVKGQRLYSMLAIAIKPPQDALEASFEEDVERLMKWFERIDRAMQQWKPA